MSDLRKEAAVMLQLVELWPEVAVQLFPNHCIFAARVVTEVCAYFGVEVRDQAVEVLVTNALGWEHSIVLNTPMAEWPDGAWTRGCQIEGKDQSPDKAYTGHVVMVTEHYLLDLSAQQFASPKRGIVVDKPILLPLEPAFNEGHEVHLRSEDGETHILYRPHDDKSYREATDWKHGAKSWRTEAAALIREMKKVIR